MKVACFGGAKIKPNDLIFLDTIRVGQLLAQEKVTIVNGGHGGIMTAIFKGAQEISPDSKRIGVPLMHYKPNKFVNLIWQYGQPANPPYSDNIETPVQCLLFRLAAMMSSDAFIVAGKGGVGTLFEFITLIELNTMIWGKSWFGKFYPRKKIAILVPEGVDSWEKDVLNVLYKHKLLIPDVIKLIKITKTPEETVTWVLEK